MLKKSSRRQVCRSGLSILCSFLLSSLASPFCSGRPRCCGVYDRTAYFCCCGGDGTREVTRAGGDAVMSRWR
ncbi:hypothetical protein KCP71_05070 [Salmonella enterica subsp. enterica]|nr:hypothetical protein KCP71_05070 [Salmonella enterica subsp. enterica]